MIDAFMTVDFAKKYLEDQKVIKVEHLEFFGQGFDNFVFLVNKQYIFRFPKTQEADELLCDENRILPALKPMFSLQIPSITFQGNPTKLYPYHVHGYEMLSGVSAYKVNLPEQQMKDCLIALAQFLHTLHRIDASQAIKLGAKKQLYDRTTIRRVIELLQHRIAMVQEKKIILLDMTFINDLIAQAAEVVIDHEHDCLVHGDLDFRHLLLTDNNLTGIIDWGDVGINNPVIDFVVVHQMFPKSMHQLFFDHYASINQGLWLYAKFLALHRSITLMLLSYEIQDVLLLGAAKNSYIRLKDDV